MAALKPIVACSEAGRDAESDPRRRGPRGGQQQAVRVIEKGLRVSTAAELVNGGRGDACLLCLPGGTLAAYSNEQSAEQSSSSIFCARSGGARASLAPSRTGNWRSISPRPEANAALSFLGTQ